MADIALRFHKDMLVLSSPLEPVLIRQGYDLSDGMEYLHAVEPEALRGAMRLNEVAGAQCMVVELDDLTPFRLAQSRKEGQVDEVVAAAFDVLGDSRPQHVFVEIGPCGLPLDPSSKNSVEENCDQYARAAKTLSRRSFDAFFLNGFSKPADIACAIDGLHRESDAPVIVSVGVDKQGRLDDGRRSIDDALAAMNEHGAAVAGFSISAPIEWASALTRRACRQTSMPVLVQLDVRACDPKQGEATEENPYFCPDTMVEAATVLRSAGAQFLRAVGAATPAYTSTLVATTEDLDVVRKVEG